MAKDLFHEAVRNALINDGWTITHDPYPIQLMDFDLDVDLGAERALAAECGLGDSVEKIRPANSTDVDTQLILDRERNHYQLVRIGWDKRLFRYSVIFHFDIKPDGKIWIQVNSTDRDVAEELEQMGVPKSDIVIGFQPPQYRPYTGYAVA